MKEAAERDDQRSTLCTALTDDIGSVHIELASCRAKLIGKEHEATREAERVQQACVRQAMAEERAAAAEAEATRLRRELEALRTERSAELAQRSVAEGVQNRRALLQPQPLQPPNREPQPPPLQPVAATTPRKNQQQPPLPPPPPPQSTSSQPPPPPQQQQQAREAATSEIRAAQAAARRAHEALNAEQLARTKTEKEAFGYREELQESLRSLRRASEECERVRKHNERLEREVATR